MNEKYGGATTLNELIMLNYGFLCNSRGEAICVTKASQSKISWIGVPGLRIN